MKAGGFGGQLDGHFEACNVFNALSASIAQAVGNADGGDHQQQQCFERRSMLASRPRDRIGIELKLRKKQAGQFAIEGAYVSDQRPHRHLIDF